MKITILSQDEKPDETVLKNARNDYMEEWVGDTPFPEIMEGVEYSSDELERAYNLKEEYKALEEYPPELVAKMWHLTHHLLKPPMHAGPYEHPKINFAIEGMSVSCERQLTRHRLASFDVQSMRYVGFEDKDGTVGEDVVEIPELDNAQLHGRSAEIHEDVAEMEDEAIGHIRRNEYEEAVRESFQRYKNLIDAGVAPENARMVLPIGTKINVCMSTNLRSLMHIADMRAAADAQWEIRDMTENVLDMAQEWAPITMTYYEENLKNRKNRLAP